MSIFDILYYIVLGFPNALFHLIAWKKMSKNNMKYNKYVCLGIIFILGFCFSLIHAFINSFVRIVLILVLLIIACRIIFENKINKILSMSFTSLIILMIGELIFSVIYIICLNSEYINVLDSRITSIIANILITVVALFVLKLPIVYKIYLKLDKLFGKIKNYYILLFSILILFSINFLFTTAYYKIDIRWLIFINTTISILYMVIIFRFFSIENKYIKMANKYNTTLTSLKEYEKILDRYKILNHENKNELLMIRNMLNKKDKAVEQYIDKMIEVKTKDDEKIMHESSVIPSGGLRAIIYSKLLIMKDKKIKNTLHVDKKVRTIDLTDYDDEFVLDLCKIVSIFIDNAIEATMLTKKKEVVIEMFLDSEDVFNISVSNTYNGFIDLAKINQKGYTTKGNGHGYGLTLASELINKHKEMKNSRKITENIFTQTITIDKDN